MLQHFEETKKTLDNNAAKIESKNKINELTKEVTQLRVETAEIKQFIEENNKTNANLFKSFKDEIQSLLKSIEVRQRTAFMESQELTQCKEQLAIEKENNNAINTKLHQLEKELKHLSLKSKEIEEKNAKSCISSKDISGVKSLTLTNGDTIQVLYNSNIAGPGWIVIQQRINGKEDFARNWTTYRNGFGLSEDFGEDFFLGLESIHRLTSEQPHELYIHMEPWNGSILFARYDDFAILGEDDQYRLNRLGAFSGITDDSLTYSKNMRFSTFDRDYDLYQGSCSSYSGKSGWWFNYCAYW